MTETQIRAAQLHLHATCTMCCPAMGEGVADVVFFFQTSGEWKTFHISSSQRLSDMEAGPHLRFFFSCILQPIVDTDGNEQTDKKSTSTTTTPGANS